MTVECKGDEQAGLELVEGGGLLAIVDPGLTAEEVCSIASDISPTAVSGCFGLIVDAEFLIKECFRLEACRILCAAAN